MTNVPLKFGISALYPRSSSFPSNSLINFETMFIIWLNWGVKDVEPIDVIGSEMGRF